MNRKYRFRPVQRDRISLRCPGTGFPKPSRSAKIAEAPRQKPEFGSVPSEVWGCACLLSIWSGPMARPAVKEARRQAAPANRCMRSFLNLPGDPHQASRVLTIHFPEHLFAQSKPGNPPPALRWNRRRRVVEVLILGFEKAIVDFVQCIAEGLLRCAGAGARVGAEQDAVLIPVEELSRGARLAA